MAPFMQEDAACHAGCANARRAKKRKLSPPLSPPPTERTTCVSSAEPPDAHPQSSVDRVASDVDDESRSGVPPHPLGVRPLGNLFSSSGRNIKHLAGYFRKLPDELLVEFLHLLRALDLLRLGATCKALYAFCRHDEIWRTLFVSSPPDSFEWLGTWRNTYLGTSSSKNALLKCDQLWSDALYRPFFCAHAPLTPYVTSIPARNQIERVPNLTHEQFTRDGWADKPFILTEPVKQWPVYKAWSTESLLASHARTCFRAEAVDWPFETYVEYMRNSNDESPLYLFDCRFAEKMGLHAGDKERPRDTTADYTPPAAFGTDLFNALGAKRPDDRWLIVGPAGSGSTFHKDPNGTSAWNAVIRGSKYWLMFPSTISRTNPKTGDVTREAVPPPPGVFLSPDGSEVTSPLSIAEYFLSFHSAARKTRHCIEGICHEGEVLHVPSGWFHLVLNLDESIALTQNFIPEAHLKSVLLFLRDTPQQISGFGQEVKSETVYDMFVDKLKSTRPELVDKMLHDLAEHDKMAAKPEGKSKWEELTEAGSAGFSFGFGGGDEDDDDEGTADIP